MTREPCRRLLTDWRDLLNQERKALTFEDLPKAIKAIFKRARKQRPGGP